MKKNNTLTDSLRGTILSTGSPQVAEIISDAQVAPMGLISRIFE
jgi:hypothetical protein